MNDMFQRLKDIAEDSSIQKANWQARFAGRTWPAAAQPAQGYRTPPALPSDAPPAAAEYDAALSDASAARDRLGRAETTRQNAQRLLTLAQQEHDAATSAHNTADQKRKGLATHLRSFGGMSRDQMRTLERRNGY
jgi:hypothetical protein